jgi:anaerobic ribonucleoside-triphosphate reductase
MERRVHRKVHARCGAGENLEIISKDYLWLLNTKSDYCQVCGYDGEISIVEDDGKLVWECPKCGNRDQKRMNVARRTCGYIGTQFWNQGRTQEIRERVLHVSNGIFSV